MKLVKFDMKLVKFDMKLVKFDMKLVKLTRQQSTIQHKHESFYPRVINNTDMTFSDKETALFGKRTRYN